MLDPQYFSVYANAKTDVFIDIDPDDEIELVGAVIEFKVYAQELGLPVAGSDPVLSKDNRDGGTLVVDDPEEAILRVPLDSSDTKDLLRNYYFECTVIDPERGNIPVAQGIMTVLGTENRPEETTT